MGPQEYGLIVGVVIMVGIMLAVIAIIDWLLQAECRLRAWIFSGNGNLVARVVVIPIWLPLFALSLMLLITGTVVVVNAIGRIFNSR